MKSKTVWMAIFCLTSGVVQADTLVLRSGKTMQGKVLAMDGEGLRFDTGGEIHFYKNGEIASIKKDTPATPAAVPAQVASVPAPMAAATGGKTIPAGTVLSVMLDGDVTSKQSAGTKFTTTLETNVLVNNQTAVPAGTKVYGKISDSRQQGLVGQSAIAIELTGFNIAGNIVPIKTEILAGSGERKAKQGARGAAAGAAIGAAAGGGGGAAKGAMIGAAASTLRRKSVGVKAGTILEFKLAAPVTLNP